MSDATSRILVLAGAAILALAMISVRPVVHEALAACAPTDKINATTAEDATKAMEKAGYSNIKILAKGCDNAWHASGTMNGQPVFIVWNKEGQVLPEGD